MESAAPVRPGPSVTFARSASVQDVPSATEKIVKVPFAEPCRGLTTVMPRLRIAAFIVESAAMRCVRSHSLIAPVVLSAPVRRILPSLPANVTGPDSPATSSIALAIVMSCPSQSNVAPPLPTFTVRYEALGRKSVLSA